VRRRNIFFQSFWYMTSALLLIVIFLSSFFFFSIRQSVAVWNVNKGQRLENLLLPLLTEVYNETGRLEELAIHEKISPFLTSNVFAYVFTSEKDPVYIYRQGVRVPFYVHTEVEYSLERLESRRRPLTAVVATGEIVGYLAADTLGFTHDAANVRFLQTVFQFILVGSLFAVFIAFFSSFWFSRFFSRQARVLVKGLKELSSGNRNISFPPVKATEMNEIAKSALQLQQQLLQEEEIRRQWADDVAHDLRTPVSGLKIQLEGLTEGVFKPTKKRLSALYEEVERIDNLVQSLRELSRVESPEMKIRRRCLDIETFVAKTVASLPEDEQNRIRRELFVKKVSVDPYYFSRAIRNILQNAFLYGEKKEVQITVYSRPPFIVFDIENYGYIEESITKKVFNRLYRGNQSRSTVGSGLGLPIARAIMQAHGGEAFIEQRGEKTHVFLTIFDPDPTGALQSDIPRHE